MDCGKYSLRMQQSQGPPGGTGIPARLRYDRALRRGTKMTESQSLPDFDLSTFLPYRLNAAAARVSRAFAERYRAFGISIPEWRVLAHLHHAGPVSVRDIELAAEMEKSKVSRAATRLESAGLIAKRVHEGDRRLVSLDLTDAGRDLLARLLPVALAYQAALVAELGGTAAGLDAGLSAILRRMPPAR
jgi:DNA-binding MarR family transcriptional regulator